MILHYEVYSEEFSRNMPIHMYLPDDYMSQQELYPVLYMFDGHNLFFDEDATYGRSWRLADHIEAREMKMIVVGLECSHHGNDRLSEYAPFPFYDPEFKKVFSGKGNETLQFILKTLKPYVDQHFPTLRDRKNTWIGGSSCGALMSIYALLSSSYAFSRAIALSPYITPSVSSLLAFAQNTYIRKPARLYLSWGAREGYNAHEFVMETKAVTDLANILLSKGVKLQFNVKVYGSHCEADWESESDSFLDFLVQ